MAKQKTEYTTVAADGTVLVHMAPKKKMRLTLTKKKALSGWLLVLPFVVGLLLVYGPILLNSLRMVFSSVTISKDQGVVYKFIGIENIKWAFGFSKDATGEAIGDPYFVENIITGLKDLLIQIPSIVIFSLFMAIILNQKMRGRTVFRAIFFLPVVLSIGVIDAFDATSAISLGAITGGIDDGTGELTGNTSFISMMDLNMLFSNVQIGGSFLSIASDLVNNIFDIVSRSGVQMLIFLSGLQSISPAIYESCQIDGASAWETFWKVTLPMISPMILVNSIYTVIDAFTSSDNRVIRHVMNDVPAAKFPKPQELDYDSLATTEMWIYVAFVALLVVVVALLMKAFVFYQKRD
jgi:ABC-type sugar transport system permease subunit